MEIINRAEAKRRGLKQYYTGEPCKNGHKVYRYTQSGTCSGCIKSANAGIVDPNKEARDVIVAKLVQAKFRMYHADLDVFKASLHAFALMRSPILREVDVWPGLLPVTTAGDAAIYKANCYPEDLDALRDLERVLWQARAGDMEAARRQIHSALQEATLAAPVPGWADRP